MHNGNTTYRIPNTICFLFSTFQFKKDKKSVIYFFVITAVNLSVKLHTVLVAFTFHMIVQIEWRQRWKWSCLLRSLESKSCGFSAFLYHSFSHLVWTVPATMLNAYHSKKLCINMRISSGKHEYITTHTQKFRSVWWV